jgi:integrase
MNITKRSGAYSVRVRSRGQVLHRTFDNRKDGKAWGEEVERMLALGATTAAGQREPMGDIIDRYIAAVDASPAKDKRNPKRIALWWKRRIGDMKIGDVGHATLRRHLLSLAGRAPATINHTINGISSIFKFAIDEGAAAVNPAKMLRRTKNRTRGAGRALTDAECRLLLTAADQTDPMIAVIVRLALDTAARQGEILRLRRRDVDLDQRLLHLRDTKNGEDRVVPMSAAVGARLRAHLRVRDLTDDRVFRDTLGHIERLWRAARDASGIAGRVRFHDLRHTALTRLAGAGATFAEIKAISGHKTSQMVMLYVGTTAPPAALVERAALE